LSIDLREQTIQNYVNSSLTYHKGLSYYLLGKVTEFHYDEEKAFLAARVLGRELYELNIYFEEDGNLESFFCDCPASQQYPGLCKHGVAVLKKAQELLTEGKRLEQQNQKAVDSIFTFFRNLPEDSLKESVNLEVVYHLEKDAGQLLSSLELKIGKERLYVVKKLKNFLTSLNQAQPIEFGKHFAFDSIIHQFAPADQGIIDLIQEIYAQENMLADPYQWSNYSDSTSFKGKKVFLSPPFLKRLFSLLQGRTFPAHILNREFPSMEILAEDLPLEFSLSQKKDDLVLAFHLENSNLIPITKEGEFFFYQENIYCPSKKQWKYLLPFYQAMVNKQGKSLSLPVKERERFISEIVPFLKNVAKLSIDPELEKNFYQEELETKIYLDKIEEGISAKVEFNYGETKINPLQETPGNRNKEKILIREVEKERKIISFFEKTEFKVKGKEMYLKEEEKIFTFLTDFLPQLQEEGEIYYSENFKIKIKDPSAFSGGVKLSQNLNLLEFSFHYPDINQAELADIFASLQKKKKYHRLKDGSFLPLDNPDLFAVADIFDQLEINPKELQDKVLHLPKYRAAYLDNQLRESGLHRLERNQAFKQMVQNIKEPLDTEFEPPKELQAILRDYQKTGFKWLKTLAYYNLGGILADDMGLGKTLQVLAFLLSEKEIKQKPALIVAPTSLVYNWQDEVRKFTPQLQALVVFGSQKERQEQLGKTADYDLVITSYPLLRRDSELYQDLNFSFCFLDEAQHIKNPNTINAKSVKEIKAENYFALTGTPIENSLTELWSIFDFIMPGYLFSHHKFNNKYERPIMKSQDLVALQQLSKQIRPFILRRMKKDVLKELPEKIESKMTVEMTPEQKKIYLAYLQKAKKEIAQEISTEGFAKSQIKILALLTRLRQICCHPALFVENFPGESGKILLLEETLAEIMPSKHRALLFSQFTGMLQIIRDYLDKERIEHLYLDGSTKAELRGEMVKEFNRGKGKIFLISLKAGGTGLNLTGADLVIHFDPWWNPAIEEQATDRAYRIGQNKAVQVMKFIAKGTIEEKIYELQQRKKELIDSVIQPGETLLSKITEKELRELLEI